MACFFLSCYAVSGVIISPTRLRRYSSEDIIILSPSPLFYTCLVPHLLVRHPLSEQMTSNTHKKSLSLSQATEVTRSQAHYNTSASPVTTPPIITTSLSHTTTNTPNPHQHNITNIMSAHQRPASSSSSSASCKAKRLLLRDIRPTPNSPSQSLLRKSDLCPHRCIYCDIWKLALIVYSRQNQNRSTPTSPSSPELSPSRQYHQPQYSTTPSPHGCISSSSPSPSSYAQALQTLESAHHLQRARLSSILSICTVPGAEESEGLRVAHDTGPPNP